MRTNCCDRVFTQNGDYYGEWRMKTDHYNITRGVTIWCYDKIQKRLQKKKIMNQRKYSDWGLARYDQAYDDVTKIFEQK